jgi:hypothetical protein
VQIGDLVVREISAEAGISYSACQVFLAEFLNMLCVSAKFAPRVPTIERKEHRLSVANDLLQGAKTNPNFKEGIITGD